jgi:hypothetical protein
MVKGNHLTHGGEGTMTVPIQLRVAAVLLWITGLGTGVFCLPAIRNLLIGRDIPYIMGLPAYGKGPFEHVGIPTTVPLLVAVLLVCILEGVAGLLLWRGYKVGAILALVLVPAGGIFWWGFALPFPPIFALVRTILIVLSWQSLK